MAGLDAQMSSLKRQAQAAERYTELTQKIQAAEARLLSPAGARQPLPQRKRAPLRRAPMPLSPTRKVWSPPRKGRAGPKPRKPSPRRATRTRRPGATMPAPTATAWPRFRKSLRLPKPADRPHPPADPAGRRPQGCRPTDQQCVAALARLETEVGASRTAVAEAEAARPVLANRAEDSERASRAAELALAKATADHAGVEAEWRVAEAAVEQAERGCRGRGRIGTAWPRRASDLARNKPGGKNCRGRCDRRPLCCRHCRKRGRDLARKPHRHQARKERLQALRDEAIGEAFRRKGRIDRDRARTHSACP